MGLEQPPLNSLFLETEINAVYCFLRTPSLPVHMRYNGRTRTIIEDDYNLSKNTAIL